MRISFDFHDLGPETISTDSEIKSLAIYTAILSYLISFVVHIWYHWAYSAFQWFFKP